MSKYTRKQKTAPKDEFVSFWERAFIAVEPYARAIGITVLTAGALIGIVWGVTTWFESRTQNATEAFDRAVRTYEAELITSDDQPKTDEENPVTHYKTEKERAEATLKLLDELDAKHPSSSAAREAKLFRAGVYFDSGRIDEAAAGYEKFLGQSKSSPLTSVAREGLGLCKEQQGKLDDALAEYQKLEPKSGDFYRDRALWNEARVLTKKGDKKAATAKLKELIEKVPGSPLKDEAQNQVAQLEGQ
jgi:predicted negative regulator of RcsB-dependent stress response